MPAGALQERGVPPGRAFVEQDASDAFDRICGLAQLGDLVVFLLRRSRKVADLARIVSESCPRSAS